MTEILSLSFESISHTSVPLSVGYYADNTINGKWPRHFQMYKKCKDICECRVYEESNNKTETYGGYGYYNRVRVKNSQKLIEIYIMRISLLKDHVENMV